MTQDPRPPQPSPTGTATELEDDLPLATELSVVFARMSGMLLSQETVQTSLELITRLAHDTLPTSVGSAVTLIDERGRRTTAATSHQPVETADALQYEMGEGPCLTAWAHRTVVRIDDTRTESRWPRWCGAVRALGVVSVLSAPLVAGDVALGAMKVYSREPAAFGADAERRLRMLAPQAAVLLANMQSHQAATELSEGLKLALRSRDVIATAKGIVMARDGLDEEAAFRLLVSASQREHAKLRDVAQDIVTATVLRRR
jgi:GAF domain-containing protein